MDVLDQINTLPNFYRDKKVFVTGHTGFKGSWLCMVLHHLGAKVYGYSLPAPTTPSLFEIGGVREKIQHREADIRDLSSLEEALQSFCPDIILHLAAQPLVRDSYKIPVDTYAINVMGTVNLLEAARKVPSIRAIVNITTDKVYENKEWIWGYRENEPFGGYDPYSSSKACSELVTAAFRSSYFNPQQYGEHRVGLASARAGNVIGGGDWANDRLIPDFIKAIVNKQVIEIRNPNAIRPWQHVLEPLAGYLILAKHLCEKGDVFAEGWNFGPNDEDAIPVELLTSKIAKLWGDNASYQVTGGQHLHEAGFLKLDCSKSKARLGWTPKWNIDMALEKTIGWYQDYQKWQEHKGSVPATNKRIFSIKTNQAMKDINSLRQEILEKTKEYYELKFAKKEFIPGKSKVNYAGRVFDETEMTNLVDSSLDFWLTEGRYSEMFAEKISEFLNVDHVLLTNSGSSANLLAFSALTSEKLGDRRLRPGDEVISVAAGFPATVTPIIQYNLVPVFIDIDIPTYNIDIAKIEKAITAKTRCIFLAHTLGNPFDLDAIMEIAQKHNLWVIEDNCDAFGSKYKGKYTGTFGHLSTISFYPAHHITTGEGGAIITNDPQLAQLVRAFRDWGRDCYCMGGENNTCGKRFSQQFGTLPFGYDHKYVYSEVGYNLKMTDMQAAIGAAQMDKLESFCNRRKENFKRYITIFSKYPQYFILPQATNQSDPAWFAFIVTLQKGSPFTRDQFTKYLSENLIETRNLFAGNMTKQPAFIHKNFRIAENLENTDYVMNNTFFLGTYPGLTHEMIDYIGVKVEEFVKKAVKMSIVKKYKSEIVDIAQPVENTYTISFKASDKKYKYNPGQFLHLALEDYDGIGQWPESRCFSMQSNPGDELIKISYSVKGAFTQQMAKQLTIGKEVWIKLPYGDLFTQEHNKNHTVFVAGGTGITPFLSLFTSAWFEQYENAVLYAGFRDESLHLYQEELQLAQTINRGFVIHTIFEDKEGRINIEDIANRQGDKADYFISGPPMMIKSFKNYLIGKGLKESQVKTDDWE